MAREMFILIPFFFIGLFYLRDKKYRFQLIFLILWVLILLISASLMGHKEVRYALPLVPAIAIISAVGISNLKKYQVIGIFIIIVALLIFFLYPQFIKAYSSFKSEDNSCLLETMNFIAQSNASFIVTEHFSPSYFYSLKPSIRVDNYTVIGDIIRKEYENESIYYFYIEGDWFNLLLENPNITQNGLYSCGKSRVYALN
jgi:uncharacterized membrane protein